MFYKKICVPLMQINSNIYAFISGILVSIATEVFTSLTYEKFDFAIQWHQFLSTILFILSGAFCMLISVKISSFQSYLMSKKIEDKAKRYQITIDATQKEKGKLVFAYLMLLLTLITSFATLALNWVLRFY